MSTMVTKEWCPGIRGMTDMKHLQRIWENEEKRYEAKYKNDFIGLACIIVAATEIDPSIPSNSMIRFRDDSTWYNIPFFFPMISTVRSTILPSSNWERDFLEHSYLITMLTSSSTSS